MYRILIVCTGNICRSPMAEGILKRLVRRHGLEDRIEVRSAGTWAADAAAATECAVTAANRSGILIGDHRSRALLKAIVRESDLILAMEPVHVEDILARDPKAEGKVYLLTTFADPEEGDPVGVIDPYGNAQEHYDATFEQLDHLLRVAFPRILERVERRAAAEQSKTGAAGRTDGAGGAEERGSD